MNKLWEWLIAYFRRTPHCYTCGEPVRYLHDRIVSVGGIIWPLHDECEAPALGKTVNIR